MTALHSAIAGHSRTLPGSTPIAPPGLRLGAADLPAAGSPTACLAVGQGRAVPGAACLLLEPGQHLVVTSLSACVNGVWQAQRHAAGGLLLAAGTTLEAAVFDLLIQQQAAVTAEHVLCSSGLVQLYQAVSEVQGWTPGRPNSQAIQQAGMEGSDDAAEQALTMFCALLGDLAGRLALARAAWGGVALGGKLIPALGPWFAGSPFRARFEAQADTGQDLRGVPTSVMPGLA
jgi:glucokinase